MMSYCSSDMRRQGVAGDARIVDQDVHGAGLAPLDQVSLCSRLPASDLTAGRAAGRWRSRAGLLVAGAVRERHGGTFLDEALGNGFADAAGGAGDEGNFSFEEGHGLRFGAAR